MLNVGIIVQRMVERRKRQLRQRFGNGTIALFQKIAETLYRERPDSMIVALNHDIELIKHEPRSAAGLKDSHNSIIRRTRSVNTARAVLTDVGI